MQHAHMVLDWNENLTREEMPPEWMWPFADEVEIWLEEVMAERNRGHGGPQRDDDEIVPLMDNDDPDVLDLLKRAGRHR